jgi:hypothetical protein
LAKSSCRTSGEHRRGHGRPDSAIVASIALQQRADRVITRKALCGGSHGRPNGPLGVALDRLAKDGSP